MQTLIAIRINKQKVQGLNNMNRAIYRKQFFSIEHVWFSDKIEKSQADVTMYHGLQSSELAGNINCAYIKINKQSTIITDLSLPSELLWKKINKGTKYEIRRAEKEEIRVAYFTGSDMPDNLLDDFEQTYCRMYSAKGMKKAFNRRLVRKYMDNNMIVFSVAYYQDEPLVFHSYIVDKLNARFYYSCSPFRDMPEISAVIGRMNRFLHWKDFEYFKEREIDVYDWGGINSRENPDGISRFKLEFGGNPVDRYNYIVANTFLGKVAFLIMRKVLRQKIK